MKGKVFFISILIQVLAGTSSIVAANDNRAAINSYIDDYKDIAIAEMHRTGIPASIKLAQAILESNAGRSYLATSANNHFGIKCGSSWTGGKEYRKDDDYDKNGKLKKSCFRAYQDAQESFIAHSEFLKDPRKARRYGFLFELDPKDYKGWAHGLKKAGYATNPKYANLLISVIHSYDLDAFDHMELAPESLAKEQELAEEVSKDEVVEKETKQRFFLVDVPRSYAVQSINKITYVEADAGDTPEAIAMEVGIPVSTLLTYNDHIYDRDEELSAGDKIFLEKKRSFFKGDPKEIIVQKGETMEYLAQRYGVRLEKLYKRNRMKEGTQPARGERIYLKGKRPKNSMPRLRPPAPPNRVELPSENTPEEVPSPSSSSDTGATLQRDSSDSTSGTGVSTNGNSLEYVVKKGDTLYSISQKFDVLVESIKKSNNLSSNTIIPGQVLIIDH